MTQQELELEELDIEIAHLEALLELRNEQRRELVNYLVLNKGRPVGTANVDLRSVK
ncbi:MAG: hypothetical protein ACRCXB_31355 [Aeromonadaceae bacterium]